MDGGAWQCKYINVNIQAYNDTKNKVKNETINNDVTSLDGGELYQVKFCRQ